MYFTQNSYKQKLTIFIFFFVLDVWRVLWKGHFVITKNKVRSEYFVSVHASTVGVIYKNTK